MGREKYLDFRIALFLCFLAPINLDQQQVAFLTLKAKRLNNCDLYSDLILGKLDGNVSSVSKPFNDFIQGVIKKFIKSSSEFSNTKNTSAILECNAEDVLRLNSVLILFWKVFINLQIFCYREY